MFLDNNDFEGSLQPVCEADPERLSFLVADCGKEVTCPCCSTCCTDGTACNIPSTTLERRTTTDKHTELVFSEDVIFKSFRGDHSV
jgi:hypothetical protein